MKQLAVLTNHHHPSFWGEKIWDGHLTKCRFRFKPSIGAWEMDIGVSSWKLGILHKVIKGKTCQTCKERLCMSNTYIYIYVLMICKICENKQHTTKYMHKMKSLRGETSLRLKQYIPLCQNMSCWWWSLASGSSSKSAEWHVASDFPFLGCRWLRYTTCISVFPIFQPSTKTLGDSWNAICSPNKKQSKSLNLRLEAVPILAQLQVRMTPTIIGTAKAEDLCKSLRVYSPFLHLHVVEDFLPTITANVPETPKPALSKGRGSSDHEVSLSLTGSDIILYKRYFKICYTSHARKM